MRFVSTVVLAAGIVLMSSQLSLGQERDRSKIPDKYKWNLADLYPAEAAWKTAKEKLIADIPAIEQYKGTLKSSAKQLLACLDMGSTLSKDFSRVAVYASLLSDEDTKNSANLAMNQEMTQIGANLSAKSSFVEPEILKIDKATIDGFVASEPGLGVYKHYLDDILRRQAHTGTEGEEKIIADAGLMGSSPYNFFSILSNADFPFPEVTLSDGKSLKLDQAAFSLSRTLPNREDRKKVFSTFFSKVNDFRRTYGTDMDANVNSHLFYMKARNYGSCLETALDGSNIPVSVYHSLVDGVNANLSTFHRYLKMRKQILNLDTLHYYDLYAPLLKNVDLKYTVEQSQENILKALAPLGKEYVATIQKAFDDRWIDMYPNEGKRSGAYSNGSAYDTHPYMLLNYNGQYDDMSTLAHELGHTMQSYLSNKKQPYPTSQYPIFVAEVASTFNEALLIEYMLKVIKDDATRLALLGRYLENIKGTVFRQTQFAEFELAIHEMAEKGEAITGDKLNDLYMKITKKYYGHDQGVCVVDDEIKAEWAWIPHFYYNFYVYQYATSFTASAALSEQVIAGDKTATQKYLTFLSSGGSKYPIDLLKDAGVDMTTSKPLELTMKKMNRVMDEMEKILAKMKK
ncbi:MAG TPA: oligoendopeptidase F [Bacteroidota bacterium]|nr:oligoendopeptidase F [Bacteroidota bacterium]